MKFIANNKIILISAFVCIVLILSLSLYEKNSNAPQPRQQWRGIDTYIPAGFKLVPIQISNEANVSPLIDAFAYVDLLKPKTKEMVAKNLRLIRSPIKNNIFAVLVEDHNVQNILQYGDEFFVVVLSRSNEDQNTEIPTQKRKIIWEES